MPWGSRKQETPETPETPVTEEPPAKEKPIVTLHINGENIEVHLNEEKASWPVVSSSMTSRSGSVEKLRTTDGRQIAVRWGHVAAITWEDQ